MCKIVLLLASCLTSIAAFPEQQRIAGGTVATLAQHPYTAVVLYAQNTVNFRQTCGGAIINNRSVLSALSCWVGNDNNPNTYRVRVGSVNATAAGVLHNVALMISHPHYNAWNQDNNIGIIRVATIITLGASVRPIPIAGSNYHLADYQMVWAIGWGRTTATSINSEQLRRVEVMTVNQGRCEDIYGVGFVTANMLCAGWQASPGRGSCLGDTGSPLVHNNVAVGVTSFAIGCGDINYPAIYSRVSRFTPWIQSNA